MARLLRISRIQLRAFPGNLASSRHPYSSWAGGNKAESFDFQSYRRSGVSKLGDWACLGLTALAGGLFWTSSSTSTEKMAILEKPELLLFLFGALRYSLQRKVLRARLKWLRLKLVVREVELKEFEREEVACMMVLEDIMEGLEGGFMDEIEIPFEELSGSIDDPFLATALILLWRIDNLRYMLESTNQFPFIEVSWMDEQLSRVELLVKRLVGFHAANEARISQNNELRAKVDELLFNLEKDR